MARRRIMEYGPTVRTARNSGMQTVSQSRVRNTEGVITRAGPGFDQAQTVKSKLSPRVRKGIVPPGYQPRNYATPEV